MRTGCVSRIEIRIERISMPVGIRIVLLPVGGRILLLGVGEDRHVAVRPHQGEQRLQVAGAGRRQNAIPHALHRRRQLDEIGGRRSRRLGRGGRPLGRSRIGAAGAAAAGACRPVRAGRTGWTAAWRAGGRIVSVRTLACARALPLPASASSISASSAPSAVETGVVALVLANESGEGAQRHGLRARLQRISKIAAYHRRRAVPDP